MKKWILSITIILTSLLFACNNDNNNQSHTPTDKTPKTLEDSLMKAIDEGHIVGMSKMAKLHYAQKDVRRAIDSIAILPAKAQQKAATYVATLNKLMKDLEYADFAMDKWMTEFEMDSAKENLEQRIKYLEDEKMKVGKMKDAILNSLQKADSLLRGKF